MFLTHELVYFLELQFCSPLAAVGPPTTFSTGFSLVKK